MTDTPAAQAWRAWTWSLAIAPEHLPRVFEPLFTTKSKGIGLGLALAKILVEAHGGAIAAESERGKGTTLRPPECRLRELPAAVTAAAWGAARGTR